MKKFTFVCNLLSLFCLAMLTNSCSNEPKFDYEAFGKKIANSFAEKSKYPPKRPDHSIPMKYFEDSSLTFHVVYGVTNIKDEIHKKTAESEIDYKKRLRKLYELSTVEEAELQLYYCHNQVDTVPAFHSKSYFYQNYIDLFDCNFGDTMYNSNEIIWRIAGLHRLNLNNDSSYKNFMENISDYEKTKHVYNEVKKTINTENPIGNVFVYNQDQNIKYISLNQFNDRDPYKEEFRVFSFRFIPINGAGVYKLWMTSRTNGIRMIANSFQTDSLKIAGSKFAIKDLKKYLNYLGEQHQDFELPSLDSLKRPIDWMIHSKSVGRLLFKEFGELPPEERTMS